MSGAAQNAHWAAIEVSAIRIQCSARCMLAKRRLARKSIMGSIDGLRIMYELVDHVVDASIKQVETYIFLSIYAKKLQSCYRGHRGREAARQQVWNGVFWASMRRD